MCPSDTVIITDTAGTNTYFSGGAAHESTITISVCEYSTYTYSTPLNAGNTYNWSVIGGNIISNNNNEITVTWGAQGVGSIFVEETDASVLPACVGDYTLEVDILATPVATLTINPATGPYCHGSAIQFTASYSNSNPPIYYQWDFGDPASGADNYSTDQSAIHEYYLPSSVTSGTFICTLVVYNECLCADTITTTINIIRDTVPEITSCINTVCEGDIVEYTANISTGQWDVQGGSILSNNGDNIEVHWDNTNGTVDYGFGTILLSNVGQNGCLATAILEVPVIPLNPRIIGQFFSASEQTVIIISNSSILMSSINLGY